MDIVNHNNSIINPNESIENNPMINNIQNWSSLNSGMLSMNPHFMNINTMNNMYMLNNNNMMLNNGYISNTTNPMINYNMNNNMHLNFPFYNNI